MSRILVCSIVVLVIVSVVAIAGPTPTPDQVCNQNHAILLDLYNRVQQSKVITADEVFNAYEAYREIQEQEKVVADDETRECINLVNNNADLKEFTDVLFKVFHVHPTAEKVGLTDALRESINKNIETYFPNNFQGESS